MCIRTCSFHIHTYVCRWFSFTLSTLCYIWQKFLQSTGGHTGGWDEYDHQIYLRTHVKHHDAGGLLEDLAHQLPARTPEDLDRHHQWYLEYSSLLRDKKAAILQWKEQKKVIAFV